MIIEKLRLRGFTGIKKGLGLEEICIDFSRISGLVAFEGDNGSGKSTVLECLHPFPQLASREGALFHHVYTRNAEKELSFTYGVNHYRTLLKIDCQSEKQEGFIWKDGNSEVKGKITEYTKYIRNLLGTPNLFFNSIFSAQKSKKTKDQNLAEMTTGTVKELFSEFLRLDRLVRDEDTAKQVINVLAAKMNQVEIRIAGLRERLAGVEKIREEIGAQQKALLDLEADLSCKKGELSSYRTDAEKLKDVIARNALAAQRKADTQATIDRLQGELGKEKVRYESERETIATKYRELQAELKKCDDTLKDKDAVMGAADREREINESLEKTLPAMERVTAELTKHQEITHAIEKEVQALKQAIVDLDNDQELAATDKGIESSKALITTQERLLKDMENDKTVATLAFQIKNCREKMVALDLKDPECKSTSCAFIVGAIQATETLPGLEKELNDRLALLEENHITISRQIDALSEYLSKFRIDREARAVHIGTEKNRLAEERGKKECELKAERIIKTTKEEALTATRQNVARLRLALTTVKDLAAKKTDVELAGFRKKDLETAMEDIAIQGKAYKEGWQIKESEMKKAIDKETSVLVALDMEIDTQAESNLMTLNGNIHDIESVDLPNIEKAIIGTRERIAALQSDLSKMADAERELKTVQAEKDTLILDISEWTYLKNGCGKNGLQALEIDGAAPLITGYANDLLARTFGPLFTVRLRTQDDEGREVLDIVVINEDGEEVLLENLSGGQKVWLLKSLRLAMTLLSAEKSGRRFESFFSDEEDGALDVENARKFIALYRSFMEIGGFKVGFYISHRPECRAMADNILAFVPGQNPEWK